MIRHINLRGESDASATYSLLVRFYCSQYYITAGVFQAIHDHLNFWYAVFHKINSINYSFKLSAGFLRKNLLVHKFVIIHYILVSIRLDLRIK
jgi:hypothetical protein